MLNDRTMDRIADVMQPTLQDPAIEGIVLAALRFYRAECEDIIARMRQCSATDAECSPWIARATAAASVTVATQPGRNAVVVAGE